MYCVCWDAIQRQIAVTAYLKSRQLLLFVEDKFYGEGFMESFPSDLLCQKNLQDGERGKPEIQR